jgi:sec-independent protein translocase protein TatB
MFNVDLPEFLFVAVLALLVIGPKDLPKVMRVVGKWVGRARAMASQFRSGFDDMIRQSELEEMEKKWREENERIMRDHPLPSIAPEAKPQPDAEPARDTVPGAEAKGEA